MLFIMKNQSLIQVRKSIYFKLITIHYSHNLTFMRHEVTFELVDFRDQQFIPLIL